MIRFTVNNLGKGWSYFSVQFTSVTQSCPTLCDPMNRSRPGLRVHHQLLEFTQPHVQWVSETFQPSHLLSTAFILASIIPSIGVFPNKLALHIQFSSVQFSRSVMSDSLQPRESQHSRPPCPSPTPGVHSTSRPSSQWGHSAISSSVVPFSSCPQSLPASESFPMSSY